MRPMLALGMLVGAVISPPCLLAQSADEILATAVSRHDLRMADVENYTLVQEMNGVATSTYYEKRTVDGRPVFVVVSPVELALRRSGMDGIQLRSVVLGSLAQAGMQSALGALQTSSSGEVATLVGTLGYRLAQAVPGASGAGGGPASGQTVLGQVDAGVLKDALVGAAVDIGLAAVSRGIAAATGLQIGALLEALRTAEGFGDALGNLARAVPKMATQTLKTGLGAVAGTGPGAGGPMPMGGQGENPFGGQQTLVVSGLMQAGVGMLGGVAGRAIRSAFDGDDRPPTDPYGVLHQLKGRARLTGTERVEGHETWVLTAEDLTGLDLGAGENLPDPERERDAWSRTDDAVRGRRSRA